MANGKINRMPQKPKIRDSKQRQYLSKAEIQARRDKEEQLHVNQYWYKWWA